MSQTLLPLVEKGKRIDGYFFDPSSEIVYFFKSIDGKKVKFSTKLKRSSYRQAQAFANRKLKELFGDKRTHVQPLIKDEIEKWLIVKSAEGLDWKTLQKIDQAILRIEPFWGSKFPREVDADSVAEWMVWLKGAFPGQQRFNALKYFRNLCRYMNQKQFAGAALLPAIPKISDPDHKKNIAAAKKKTERTFTPEEFRRLIKVGDRNERMAGRIMYAMATRIEETLAITLGEQIVRNDEGNFKYIWTVGQNKADHVGSHDCPDWLNRFLEIEWERLSGKGRLFPQLRDASKALSPQYIDFTDWRHRAKLGWHWTSKTFRHTCLTRLFNDPRYPHIPLCQKYRISLDVAAKTYVKSTEETARLLKNASAAWV